jgi:ribosomal protein L15E
MNQWVEEKDGKQYWYQQYSKAEMVLLKKYHKAIGRLTNINLRGIL